MQYAISTIYAINSMLNDLDMHHFYAETFRQYMQQLNFHCITDIHGSRAKLDWTETPTITDYGNELIKRMRL